MTAPREPGPEISGPALLSSVLAFGRELKREGLTADLAAVLDFCRALTLIDIGDREEVKAAGEALFVRRREELDPYQHAFDRFWRRRPRPVPPELEIVDDRKAPEGEETRKPGEAVAAEADGEAEDSADGEGNEEGDEVAPSVLAYSSGEQMRTKAFERMSPQELREAERAIDAMLVRLPLRRTRRWQLHPGGRHVAPRQMFRRNLATGGDPLAWLWRRHQTEPRSIVLLCDISGSMERHARLLLRFGHALARSEVRTESFVFGTRLTRITPQLRHRDPDRALDRVSAAVTDWSGGTRIGGSFREFNQRWARRVLRTSGIVIVISDGWDRGDPAVVGEETARLRRNCHRLIWLNPLAGSKEYRPLAAGMAAAYPHLDVFLPGHDLASLEALAKILSSDAGDRAGISLR
ncbi:MAG: VWA domain-containing protein [Chloroflexota bacterium]